MPTNIGDIIEASARMEFNGVDDQINVYEYSLGTPGPISDANTVTDILTIMEGLYTLWRSFMTVAVLFRDIRIRNKTQGTVLGTFLWPTLTTGLAAAMIIPPGNCALINFNSDVARVTPRKYFGGMDIGSLDLDGSLNATVISQLTLMAADLLSVQVEASGDWLYGVLSSKTMAFEFPLSATITDISAYQRRRKQGRGS